MARKSKEQIRAEQHSAVIISTYKAKNYGQILDEDEYINLYSVPMEDAPGVAYIKGEAKVTKNLGDFNSVSFSSSVMLPFIFDASDPESSDNKARAKHAMLLRDTLLEEDLTLMETLAMEKFNT